MKVVPFIVSAMLAFAGAAHADEYAGPPPPPAAAERPAGPLRQALLDRFDANHDGRLERKERRHAIRALRKMQRALVRRDRVERRAMHEQRRAIRRYDLNGDGNVDPSEMPPAAAARLRHLDRNGDGWVDDGDF